MKTRSTYILLGVGLALGGYVWLVDSKQKTTREQADSAGHVVQLDRDKITSISLRSPESKLELRKHDDGQWYLEDLKDRADSTVIAQLFTAVETLRSDAVIPVDKNKDLLRDDGITESNTKVKFSGGGAKPVELVFGKDTAVEGKTYLYVDGGDQVYAVGNDLKNQVSKKPDDFRDRKLTDLTAQKVTKLQIKSPAGEMELTKKNNHWSLVKPMEARGDDSKVNDLIAQAATAHIDQFMADQNLATYGLSEPRGSLTFTVEGTDKPVVLQIGAHAKEEKDKEKTYVKLSSRDAVVLVPKSIETALTSKPNDLRDHNLLRVESDIVDRMGVELASGEKYTLGRKGESWVRKEGTQDEPINVSLATRLLADLQAAQVTEFVSDVGTGLEKYGLDQPAAKVTFSSYASENTAETKAGEKPIVTVLFGKTEGEKVYAKLDNEPFVVAVPLGTLEAVPPSAIALRENALFHFKPEELTSLELHGQEAFTESLERQKDGTWKMAKGEGKVDQGRLSGMVTTLASLTAVRWVGPIVNNATWEDPHMVVDFDVTQGDRKTHQKLTIGPITSDELYESKIEGKDGSFLLGKADAEVFAGPQPGRPAAPHPPAPGAVNPHAGIPGAPPLPLPGESIPGKMMPPGRGSRPGGTASTHRAGPGALDDNSSCGDTPGPARPGPGLSTGSHPRHAAPRDAAAATCGCHAASGGCHAGTPFGKGASVRSRAHHSALDTAAFFRGGSLPGASSCPATARSARSRSGSLRSTLASDTIRRSTRTRSGRTFFSRQSASGKHSPIIASCSIKGRRCRHNSAKS